jgi:lipooligosaccharide transport system ATP-binding protein
VAVRLRNVVKKYAGLVAVDGLSLDVRAGTCLGLLGPNGAGKSTTMRMLTGLALPDSGEIEVLGWRLPAASREARACVGVVPQHDNLDIELSVRQNLEVFARLARVPKPRIEESIARTLRLTKLTERAGSRVESLSGGMRRRLLLARGVIAGPSLLLLDEPTVGLDPQIRQELWDLIDEMRTGGSTVLMSTHYIEEAERLADEVAVMYEGRLIAHGTVTELLAKHVGRQAAEYQGTDRRRGEVIAIATAADLPSRRTGLAVSVLRAEDMPQSVHDRLGPPDVLRRTNLEDVFVTLTGEVFA